MIKIIKENDCDGNAVSNVCRINAFFFLLRLLRLYVLLITR
jgi:hypothetical protein